MPAIDFVSEACSELYGISGADLGWIRIDERLSEETGSLEPVDPPEFRFDSWDTSISPEPDMVEIMAKAAEIEARPADHSDAADLDEVINSTGVLRAVGLVMFDEINKLRVKNGDPEYTMAQFKSALVAKMR